MRKLFPTVASIVGSVVVLGTALSGQALKQSDLQKTYGPRWIVLPLPDSRVSPGAIVSIRRGEVAVDSNLSTCGASAGVTATTASASDTVTIKGDAEYAASAVLKLPGLEVGPDFSKAKTTTLKLNGHHAEGLDALKVGMWWSDPSTHLAPACQKFLTDDNTFVVLEAYRADGGEFTLHSATNAKLSVTAALLKLTGNASAKVTADGTIEFSQPMYLAIRRLKLLKGGDFKTLGSTATPGGGTDDAKARALLMGTGKSK